MDVVTLIRVNRPSGSTPLVRPDASPVRLVMNRGPVIFNQAGSGDVLSLIATASFSSGRLVAYVGGQLVYYDAGDITHLFALKGMTINAANPGEVLQIKTQGDVTIAGWNLAMDQPYFAAIGGQLSLHPVSNAAFCQVVGRAKTADTFMLSPQSVYKNG